MWCLPVLRRIQSRTGWRLRSRSSSGQMFMGVENCMVSLLCLFNAVPGAGLTHGVQAHAVCVGECVAAFRLQNKTRRLKAGCWLAAGTLPAGLMITRARVHACDHVRLRARWKKWSSWFQFLGLIQRGSKVVVDSAGEKFFKDSNTVGSAFAVTFVFRPDGKNSGVQHGFTPYV